MRLLSLLLACLMAALFLTPAANAANAAPQRVLLIVSSHGENGGETSPGFEMDELSEAWLILRQNGFEVEIASPKGGAPVADKYDPKKPYNAAFLADPKATAALANTRPITPALASRYQALFLMGGKGAMFDFPSSQPLQQLILAAHARGAVIGSVCHGPAALALVKTADGRALVQGVRLTGFSNAEEDLFGKRWRPHFPFDLETALREKGAVFTQAQMMLPHVETDGRFVSGQNPYSTAAATEAIVRALGQTPASRAPWADERSMELLARLIAGQAPEAAAELRQNPSAYDMPLIAIWGYYQSLAAGDDPTRLQQGLAAMDLALPHVDEPQLKAAAEKARARLQAIGR